MEPEGDLRALLLGLRSAAVAPPASNDELLALVDAAWYATPHSHTGLEPRTSRPQTALLLTRSGLAFDSVQGGVLGLQKDAQGSGCSTCPIEGIGLFNVPGAAAAFSAAARAAACTSSALFAGCSDSSQC